MKRGEQKRTRTAHGMTGNPTHNTWENMWNRCTPGSKQNTLKRADTYRSITVCARWKRFDVFLKDMGHRPKGKTLERRNNRKGYSPNNCKWATRQEQQRNRSTNVRIKIGKRNWCVAAWARLTGVPEATVHYRLRSGVPSIQAVGLVPFEKRKTGPTRGTPWGARRRAAEEKRK